MRRQPGMGSVFKRKSDGRWVAQVSKGPRHQRSFITRSAPTRTEARALLPSLLRSTAGARTTDTTGDYLEQWVNEARDIRDTTRRGYRAVVNEHLRPTIGHIRLRDLSPAHVETALTVLSARMSPKTLRNVHAALRRALGQAQRQRLIPANVASREYVDVPKVPEQEPRALSGDEVDRFLAAAKGDRLEALYVLAVGTGLRQGEILGLAWEDIDTVVHVRQEQVRANPGERPAKYKRGPLKTARSRRDVPLSPSLIATLEAHKARMRDEGFVPVPGGPVFVNGKGDGLSGSWVTHHFYRLLRDASVPRVPFKNLRTTFATRLEAAGVSDVTIAALMGHSRTHTTRKHYIATPTGLSALDAMERLVAPQSRLSHAPVGGAWTGVA
jgi:integrase